MNGTLKFTDANFQSEVLDSSRPVLVDVWAPWCAPCRAMGPMIDEIAAQGDGHVKVGKLNVDENSQIAQSYDVSSIPTVLVFKDGQVVERLVGVQTRERYQQAVDAAAA